jgi:hypothetical protein
MQLNHPLIQTPRFRGNRAYRSLGDAQMTAVDFTLRLLLDLMMSQW